MKNYHYSKLILLFINLSLITNIYSQPGGSFIDDKRVFISGENTISSISNSVNLSTGTVNLPIHIVSMNANNKTPVNVSINYNSALAFDKADRWNKEGATGILGLGWSFSIPKILTDNKGTGTRIDDDFYFEGIKLLYTGQSVIDSKTAYNYILQNMTQWKFSYIEDTEKWIVLKNDGTKLIFGNNTLNDGNAIEWIWKWGGWIGNSKKTTGLGKQALVWNLSEQEDREGNKVYYTYQKVERYLGSISNKNFQTEASYIRRIQDDLGRRIIFNYENKYPEEYIEENIEIPEIGDFSEGDAYQERIEKKYLKSVELASSENDLIKKIEFNYLLKGPTNTKRLLSSIITYNHQGIANPATDFIYYLSGDYKNLLNKVSTPEGANLVYNYSIRSKSADIKYYISPPDANYDQVMYWHGEDYIIVAWRNKSNKNVKIYRYQWNNLSWTETYLKDVSNVELDGEYSFQYNPLGSYNAFKSDDISVSISNDYFTIKDHNNLNIYYKNKPYDTFSWTSQYYHLDQESWSIRTGDGFILTAYKKDNGYTGIEIIKQKGKYNSWTKEEMQFTDEGYYKSTIGENYFIVHNRAKDPDKIHLFYLDRNNIWIKKDFPVSLMKNSDKSEPSILYGANSWMLLMMTGNDEYIYHWDENYNIIQRFNPVGAIRDESYVRMRGNSLLGIYPYYDSGYGLHFDGVDWKSTGKLDVFTNGSFSPGFNYGIDFMTYQIYDDGNKVYYHRFNPNNSTWSVEDKLLPSNHRYLVNSNSLMIDNNIHSIRNGNISSYQYNYSESTRMAINNGLNRYFCYDDNYHLYVYQNNGNNNFEENKIYVHHTGYGQVNEYFNPHNVIQSFNKNTIIWGLSAFTDKLSLIKFSNKSINYSYKTAVVSSIEIQNTTTDKQYVHFEYFNPASDYSGNSLLFNKVRQSKSTASILSYSKGYTDYYFANGQRKEDLLIPDGYNMMTDISTGTMYASVVYNSNNEIKLSNYKEYITKTQNILINSVVTGKIFSQFITKDITIEDSYKELITYFYYSNSTNIGDPIRLNQKTVKDPVTSDGYTEFYNYLDEYYDFANQENLKNVIISEKRYNIGLPGKLLSAGVSIWELSSNSKYYPTKNYIRKIEPDNTIGWTYDTYLELLNSSENWIQTQSLVYDSYGNVIEQFNPNTGFVKTNYIKNGNKLLAKVNGAKHSEIFFDNFEDNTENEWTSDGAMYGESLTYDDTKSFTGNSSGKVYNDGNSSSSYVHANKWLNINLDKPKKFKYSGWVYSDGPISQIYLFMNENDETEYFTIGDYVRTDKKNKWVYLEKEFEVPDNIDKINLRVEASSYVGNVWFDDLRLYPADADMTTYTSNDQQGVTSVSSELGRVTKNIFNDKGKLEFVVDEKDNVLEQRNKNLKKEIAADSPGLTEINNISKSSISFGRDGEAALVNINTNDKWDASVTSGSLWISLDKITPGMDGVLKISVSYFSCNSGNIVRNGNVRITFISNGKTLTKDISITQKMNTSCNNGYMWDSYNCECIIDERE